MNVASATSTVSRPFAFMTPRGSDAVDGGAGARIPATTSGPTAEAREAEPLVNRFPTIAFSYDTDASRLVMLYRDPANGKTVSQIPTEAALKQYKEAQQQEKNAERAALLKLTVGGAQGGGSQGGGAESGRAEGMASAAYGRGSAAGSAASGPGNAGNSIGSGRWLSGAAGSAGGVDASAAAASVSQSATSTAVSAGTSAARVNVVI
ncbi:hypothetical protein [Azospirillum sp.]|uniref:hypothetical protein n=1 Tax=Azospirillum sp. TaxID=34012 RepID=UPI002D30EBF6|nr:hypothetical protein [Azospirillum sp.]HYF86411.1 hypothetical protein [Azospirillum sp.]